MYSPTITYRDLITLEEFAEVVDLERQIWGPGYDEVVPVPILAVTVKRGGILIGAFAGEAMIGFVYSLPGIKDGRPVQWSHMLGVLSDYRRAGVGYALKLRQRDRTLAMNLDLIEWTFDPLQAANAHLNLARLGAIVEAYEENVYGNSTSPLHKGNPTDRFVAKWWVRQARIPVENSEAAHVNRAAPVGEWLTCAEVNLELDRPRVAVEIPTGFTSMLSRAPDLALEWRLATRRIFSSYFMRKYRAVDFTFDAGGRSGSYLLIRPE